MSITYKGPNNTLLTGGVTPDNKLWFYGSTWFDKSYQNSLWFATKSNQWSWFEYNRITSFDDTNFTYAIKDEYSVDFRVPYNTEKLYECGYVCRIKNYGVSGKEKRYYYFIDSVDAYSPNSSIIHCTLDVIQTFMFTWKLGNQHLLRNNGIKLTSLDDPRCLSNEDFMPAIEECSKTEYLDPEITDSVLGITRHAFSQKCFLVVCTQAWFWDTDSHTESYVVYQSGVGLDDPSELVYCVFLSLNNTRYFLNQFTGTNKNKIKGVYGIPFICAFGGTRIDGTTDENTKYEVLHKKDDSVLGYIRRTGSRKFTHQINIPTTFYQDFTPNVNKTRMVNCLSIESRSGKSAMYKMTDLHWDNDGSNDKITLTVIGILSISPKVIVLPHALEESGIMKSSNYLTFDINPSFSVYDDSGAEIYNRNYETAMSVQSLSAVSGAVTATLGVAKLMAGGGSLMPLIAGSAMISGITNFESSVINMANLSATYQEPQNIIGTCESSDIWFNYMDYVVIRWLSPTRQNMQALDNYLSTDGYNMSGTIVDCGNPLANGYGVHLFGRNYFNFIQTDKCKLVSGNVGIYKNKIENIFNNGIRFWKVDNATVFANGIGNYTSGILSGN